MRLLNLLIVCSAMSSRITDISAYVKYPSASAKRGSYAGGTELFVWGEFDYNDPSLYKVLIGGKECRIEQFYFTESYFMCYTPPYEYYHEAVVQIEAFENGSELPIDSSVDTTFEYSYQVTPRIYYVSPTEATEGDEISFYGQMWARFWRHFEEMKVAGKKLRVFSGKEYSPISYPYPANLTGVLASNVHDERDPLIRFVETFGAGMNLWVGQSYTLEGEPYSFRTIAAVEEISHHSGSSEGGLSVNITGRAFPSNTSRIVAEVNGQECKLSYASYHELICETGSSGELSTQFFEGSAGFVREIWYKELAKGASFEQLIGNVEPNKTVHMAALRIPTDEDAYVKSRMYGLFKAPRSGNYTFYVSSDDYAMVFFSSNMDPFNKKPIIEFSGKVEKLNYFLEKTSISPPMELQANTSYYFEVWHSQFSGNTHFSMGVEVPGDGVTRLNRLPLVHNITVEPPQIVREVHQIQVFGTTTGPTGGALKVVYGTSSSKEIFWDSDLEMFPCSEILKELNSLSYFPGSLKCTSEWLNSNSLSYNITFDYPKTDTRKLVTFDRTLIEPKDKILTSTLKHPGTLPINGPYKVAFKGFVNENYGGYLESIPLKHELDWNWHTYTFNSSSVMLTGNYAQDYMNLVMMLPSYLFNETTEYASIILGDVQGGVLEGSSESPNLKVTNKVVTEPNENQFWFVVPSDFLRTFETSSQLRVWVDNRLTLCRGNCSFTYEVADSVITEFYLNSTILTILGQMLPANDANITLAHAPCKVILSTQESIQCSYQSGVYGSWKPQVYVKSQGLLPVLSSQTIQIPLVLDSVKPQKGSIGGGNLLTLKGSGFWHSMLHPNYNQSVYIGDSECFVKSTSVTEIKCLTSPIKAPGNLTLTVNGFSVYSDQFSYDTQVSPEIKEVTPQRASTVFKTEISINGTGFSSDKESVSVKIGSEDCLVTYSSFYQVKCNFLGGPKGDHNLVVQVKDKGNAVHSFRVSLEVSSVYPNSGSVYGGVLLNITGYGFSDRNGTVLVHIQDPENPTYRVKCSVEFIDAENILCRVPKLPHFMQKDQAYEVIVTGRIQQKADCTGWCWFTWASSATPEVLDIFPISGVANQSVELIGKGFGTHFPKVHFNEVPATVKSLEDTKVVVEVPSVSGSSPEISVFFEEKGHPFVNSSVYFSNEVAVAGVSPKEISQAGGFVKVLGSGLDSSMKFFFGSTNCEVLEITNTYARCRLNEFYQNEELQPLRIEPGFQCESPNCSVRFLSNKTFEVSSVSGDLAISGNFPPNVQVYLEKFPCKIQSTSSSEIVCVPHARPGDYQVTVHADSYGFLKGQKEYKCALKLFQLSTVESSYAGGKKVTLSGNCLTEELQAKVCGFRTRILEAHGNELVIETPALVTSYSMKQYDLGLTPQLVTQFKILGSGDAYSAFDKDQESYYTYNAELGIDIGENRVLQLTQIRVLGGGSKRFKYEKLLGLKLQGSKDSVNWDDLYMFDTVNPYWNKWVVPSEQQISYRYFRLFKEDPTKLYINEVEFYGFLVLENSSNTTLCDLEVSYKEHKASVESAVLYSKTATPELSSLEPKLGTSLGGTPLEILGTGFTNNTLVFIDSVPCRVTKSNTSYLSCLTGKRTSFAEPSLRVIVQEKGLAVNNFFKFVYAGRWSDTATWSGEVPPRQSESVWIPKGQSVLLDTATPVLNTLLVEGTLIVEDKSGVSLDANIVFIKEGNLVIGSQESPYLNDLAITLHGEKDFPSLPFFGNKVLGVLRGNLEIYGKPQISWTLLRTSAFPNDTTISLVEEVNWAPGEKVVIAPTSYNPYEAEVLTIASVQGNNVTFIEPVKFLHYSSTLEFPESIEMKAEVGLLSHNIKIRGTGTGYGAHLMASDSKVKVQNLEIYNAGKPFELGRSAITLDQVNQDSSIRNTSIHHSFNRAVSVRASNHIEVKNNVAFHIKGHCFSTEDGIEIENTIQNNLGIQTLKSQSLTTSDQYPAIFKIRNPKNFVTNNHAAGSDMHGFSYDLAEKPQGASAPFKMSPVTMSLGMFFNNAAHSNLGHGLVVDHTPSNLANYCNFTSWKNSISGVLAGNLGSVNLKGFKVADNKHAGIEVSSSSENTKITKGLFVGYTPNSEGNLESVGLITPQTDGLLIDTASFANFNDSMWPIGDGSEASGKTDSGARLHKMQGLSFNNSHSRIHWGFPYRGIYDILDSSLTGSPNVSLSPYWEHLLTSECLYEESYNSVVCSKKIRRVKFHNLSPSWRFRNKHLNIVKSANESWEVPSVNAYDGRSWAVPLVTQNSYSVNWEDANWNSIELEIDTFEKDQWVEITMNFSSHVEHFEATRGETPKNLNGSDPTLLKSVNRSLSASDPSGTYTWNNKTEKFISILLSGNPQNEFQFGDIRVKSYGCYGDHCKPKETTPSSKNLTEKRWSSKETWESGKLPEEGEVVVIPSDWEIILDIETPVLAYIEINGVMKFDRNSSVTLNSYWVFVRGQVLSTPDNYTHEIVLHGTQNSPPFYFSGSRDAGNKVLAVAGKLEMHGNPRTPRTALERDLKPHQKFIYVKGVDWTVGDEILVESWSFDQESEVFEIQSIESKNSWQRIKLDRPAEFYHSSVVYEHTLKMQSQVVLLTRNAKIKGSNGNWKCNFLVSDYLDYMTSDGIPRHRSGQVSLSNVEISNCGQTSSEKAALKFENTGLKPSKVESSVIKNSDAHGVYFSSSSNIEFLSNIIYKTLKTGVLLDHVKNTTVLNNIVAKAGIGFSVSGSSRNVSVVNNEASEFHTGFSLDGCQDYFKHLYNSAHTGQTGLLIAECSKVTDFSAYHTLTGIASSDSTQKFLENLVLVENSLGINFNSGIQLRNSYVCARSQESFDYKVSCESELLNEKVALRVLGHSICENITLSKFQANECGVRSFVVESNLGYSSIEFKGTKLLNTSSDSLVYMEECTDCNNLVKDLDGSLLGNSYGGDFIPNYPEIAKSTCTFNEIMDGYVCAKDFQDSEEYGILTLRSSDKQRIPSITISSFSSFTNTYNQNFSSEMNYFAEPSEFSSLVYTGTSYNLTGTLPSKLQVELLAPSQKKVILSLKYQDPSTVQVSEEGTVVEPIQYKVENPRVCSLQDLHGTNRWFHEDKMLQFVVSGGKQLTIEQVESLKLTLEIDTTIQEFFAEDGDTLFVDRLAAALGIPVYRIRIASVRKGSVVVNLLVKAEENKDDLEEVMKLVSSLTESGELENQLQVPVIKMQAELDTKSASFETQKEPQKETQKDTQENTQSFSIDLEVIGALLIALLVTLSFILVCYLVCRYKRASEKVIQSSTVHKKEPSKKVHAAWDTEGEEEVANDPLQFFRRKRSSSTFQKDLHVEEAFEDLLPTGGQLLRTQTRTRSYKS